jgi:hypothetical protein
MVPIKGTRARLQAAFFGDSISNELGTRCPQRVGKGMQLCRLIQRRFRGFFWHRSEADWHFSEKPIHLTGAEWCAAQKLETGWLLAQALRSQPESVW